MSENNKNKDNNQAENGKEKTRRHLSTQVLGVEIAHARCANHIKLNLNDQVVVKNLQKFRKEHKAENTTEERKKELEVEIKKLASKVVRLSSDAPIAASVVADFFIKEILRHALDQTLASDYKMVNVIALHQGQTDRMVSWPLIKNLPAYSGYNKENEEELKKERAAANKAKKDMQAKKKENGESAKARGKEKNKVEDGEESHSRTTFQTYVDNALKKVKKEDKYKDQGVRVTKRVREVCSDIVTDFLIRLARVARIIVMDMAQVRTLHAKHVKSIIRIWMVDENRSEVDIKILLDLIDEKLGKYQNYRAEEKEKKEKNMSDEDRATKEANKKKADIERKQRKIETNAKRMIVLEAENRKLKQGEAPGS